MNNDLVNGLFELFSGILSILNVMRLVRDKQLKGVSWVPLSFFTMWGAWNLYYYPALGQTLSFVGASVIFSVNVMWLGLVAYYGIKNRKKNNGNNIRRGRVQDQRA